MYNLNMAQFFINDRARAKNEYYAEFPKQSANRLGALLIKMLGANTRAPTNSVSAHIQPS